MVTFVPEHGRRKQNVISPAFGGIKVAVSTISCCGFNVGSGDLVEHGLDHEKCIHVDVGRQLHYV